MFTLDTIKLKQRLTLLTVGQRDLHLENMRGHNEKIWQETPENAHEAQQGRLQGLDRRRRSYSLGQVMSKKHPGFAAVQKRIAKSEGVPMKNAGAILAVASRRASPAAKKANPRLKKV